MALADGRVEEATYEQAAIHDLEDAFEMVHSIASCLREPLDAHRFVRPSVIEAGIKDLESAVAQLRADFQEAQARVAEARLVRCANCGATKPFGVKCDH